jgi:hypothetical protein
MAKLTDLHLTLLARAAQRDSGSVHPLPETSADVARTNQALAVLVKRGLADERETRVAAEVARVDGDRRFGLFITTAGLAAIGIVEDGAAVDGQNRPDAEANSSAPSPAPAAPRSTKAGLVLDLLRRDEGATLAELVAATGWLQHTTRAALTGLRKKGHAVARGQREGTTCYRIAAAEAA